MVQQAHRHIYIMSQDLEAHIYNSDDFEHALAQLAKESQHTHIHILLKNSEPAIKYGHRLINLAQRLSSKVKIHNPHEEHAEYNEAFLLVDDTAYIKRKLADRYEGVACFKALKEAGDLSTLFHEMWERSEPDSQLRRLTI
ncbi:MAG: acyltransferase, partial [Gammaproteobacteria bacterium]|nr:acyltransferase [Gammaproteobacteria bacterium]